jgi:hypothetical protein
VIGAPGSRLTDFAWCRGENSLYFFASESPVSHGPSSGYSYRSASIGFSLEAFRARKNPETIPTSERIVNEIIITLMEACRKIAPS